ADAARVLARALSAAKDPLLRVRIGADLGEMLLEVGDAKKAKAALQGVLELGNVDEGASLRAARALAKLATDGKDHRLLANVLAKLAEIETDPVQRLAAIERLAWLCEGELKDAQGAIAAYKKLLGTKHDDQALLALERLYDQAGAHEDLANVLE